MNELIVAEDPGDLGRKGRRRRRRRWMWMSSPRTTLKVRSVTESPKNDVEGTVLYLALDAQFLLPAPPWCAAVRVPDRPVEPAKIPVRGREVVGRRGHCLDICLGHQLVRRAAAVEPLPFVQQQLAETQQIGACRHLTPACRDPAARQIVVQEEVGHPQRFGKLAGGKVERGAIGDGGEKRGEVLDVYEASEGRPQGARARVSQTVRPGSARG